MWWSTIHIGVDLLCQINESAQLRPSFLAIQFRQNPRDYADQNTHFSLIIVAAIVCVLWCAVANSEYSISIAAIRPCCCSDQSIDCHRKLRSSLENGSVAWQVVKNVWKSIFLFLARDRQQPFKKYRWCVLLVLNDEWWCTGYDGRCGCLMVVAFVRVRIKESDFNIRFLGDKEEGAEESGWTMPIEMVIVMIISFFHIYIQSCRRWSRCDWHLISDGSVKRKHFLTLQVITIPLLFLPLSCNFS